MSKVRSFNSPMTAQALHNRKRKTQSCKTRRRKRRKLYERYLQCHPEDTCFANLKIDDALRLSFQPGRSDLGTAHDEIFDDTEFTTYYTLPNEDQENRLDYKGGVNPSGSNSSSSSSQTKTCTTIITENTVMPEKLSNDNSSLDAVLVNPCANGIFDAHDEQGDDNDKDDGHSTGVDESDVSLREEELDQTMGTEIQENNIFSLAQNNDWLQPLQFKKCITKLYMIMCVIALSLRGKMSYLMTVNMFKSLGSMLVDSSLPRSIRSLWSTLGRNDKATTTRHLYCRKCIRYLGQGEKPDRECGCKKSGLHKNKESLSYFIQIGIIPQLRQLFAHPATVNCLRYRFTRIKKNSDATEDIYDGAEYKKHCKPGEFLSHKNNFSFTLWTDGARVTTSSKASAWPILLQVNEFSPHARKRHMILAGIWVDTVHPDQNAFLFPTMKELQYLYHTGITWTNPVDNTEVTSKFITLVCTFDSMARPDVLNMTRFNGEYGCTFCYHPGVHLPMRGVCRRYPVNDTVACRTDSEIRKHMKQANEQGRKFFGVKGYAAVALLEKFDLSSGIIVDSMHNVYLGVVKFHTELLLTGKANDAWYAGNPKNISKINARLDEIRIPSLISRTPRRIEEMKTWKASEWKNWIQFYALPCLEGIIHAVDLQLLALLSRSTYTLNKDCISTEELQEARLLLDKYIRDFQKRYGIKNMRFNIHLLSHLVDTVANWGPFWTHNGFNFESWNKGMIDKVSSPTSRPLQITTRFLMTRFLESLFHNPEVPQQVKQMVNSIMTDGLKKQDFVIDYKPVTSKFTVNGLVEKRAPNTWESKALLSAGYQPQILSFYKRAMVHGIDYRCHNKNNTETRYCGTFVHCQRIEFGNILEIVSFDHNDAVVHGLLVQRMSSLGNTFGTRHIRNFVFSSDTVFVTVNDEPVPALVIKTLKQLRVIKLPNVWETD